MTDPNLRPPERPPICDYEGTDYRTRFWENKGRDYEDAVERIALRRLLPPNGGTRFLEIGAGFGRLTDEYVRFQHVVLLDYSLSQMQDAQERLGKSSRYTFVAADLYRMPFKAGVFDGVSVVRVLHHIADVPLGLREVRRVLTPRGVFILEHASKRHLKSILRWFLKRQTWNPFDYKPVEFVELNFDFHPEYIRHELENAHFHVERRVPVSYLRNAVLKRLVPTAVLAGMDGLLQLTGGLYAPSVFVRSIADGSTPENVRLQDLFACPDCGGDLIHQGDVMRCANDGQRWAIRDGIYDFKAPLD
jgi:ubiquinone/menaquinone biosynthesis C-methylase UbiE